MRARDLIRFWRPLLRDPGHGWSVGTFGAIGEFTRDEDEPAAWTETPHAISVATARGALRLDARAALKVIAYDTLSKDGETWSQTAAFCRRAVEAVPQAVTPLGPDAQAVRPQDRDAPLFDLGVGLGEVSMAVRTRDADLIGALEAARGRSLFSPEAGGLMAAFLKAQPHRIMLSPAARLEVMSPIPPPDGQSPEGPHTHLLPRLIASRRAASATAPIPEGWRPVLNLHPRSPWRDLLGRRIPFDARADAAFEALLADHALAGDRAVRRAVEAAVAGGAAPDAFAWPASRRGRAQARIALRRLAAKEGAGDRTLAAWRALYDRAPVEADDDDA